jgi:hypothetical protein
VLYCVTVPDAFNAGVELMIQPTGWTPDSSVSTATATDLQSLLEALVKRYRLMGAVVATTAAAVRAQVGPSLAEATDGFAAALAGHAESLVGLAQAIEGKALPRYFSQGVLDAYADVPQPGLVALFMRERTNPTPPTELELVSDYNIAKEMTAELRTGMQRLTTS